MTDEPSDIQITIVAGGVEVASWEVEAAGDPEQEMGRARNIAQAFVKAGAVVTIAVRDLRDETGGLLIICEPLAPGN